MLSYLLAGTAIGPVVSQSFLDLSIFLIFICFIVLFFRKKQPYSIPYRKPYIFEYGFVFYIIAIVSELLILKVADPESWYRLYKFHWVINFYLFVWALSHYEINLSKLSKFFAFAFLLPNIYAIASTLAGYNWLSNQTIHNFRLQGLTESATYHAHGNGLILSFFLVILFFQFKKLSTFYRYLSILAVSLMSLGIVMTFTRGILLSLSVSILAFLFFHSRKYFIAGLISGAVLLGGLYSFSDSFRYRFQHTLQTKTADSERWNLLKVHILMFKESPLIGIGYANNLSHTPPETWTKFGFSPDNLNSHAHNQFLNVLTTTGLIGFMPFIVFYFWFFITNLKLVKKYKTNKMTNHYILATACLIAQLEFLIANLSDVGFEYTKIRSLILLVWALVFVLWRDNVKFASTDS